METWLSKVTDRRDDEVEVEWIDWLLLLWLLRRRKHDARIFWLAALPVLASEQLKLLFRLHIWICSSRVVVVMGGG